MGAGVGAGAGGGRSCTRCGMGGAASAGEALGAVLGGKEVIGWLAAGRATAGAVVGKEAVLVVAFAALSASGAPVLATTRGAWSARGGVAGALCWLSLSNPSQSMLSLLLATGFVADEAAGAAVAVVAVAAAVVVVVVVGVVVEGFVVALLVVSIPGLLTAWACSATCKGSEGEGREGEGSEAEERASCWCSSWPADWAGTLCGLMDIAMALAVRLRRAGCAGAVGELA